MGIGRCEFHFDGTCSRDLVQFLEKGGQLSGHVMTLTVLGERLVRPQRQRLPTVIDLNQKRRELGI